MNYKKLTAEYRAKGFTAEQAHEEAAREIRLTVGDPYLYRTDEELAEMRRIEAEAYEALREAAGVCDEFPAGEFAVPGFNCDLGHYGDEDY